MARVSRTNNTNRIGRVGRGTALTAEVQANRKYLSETRNPYDVPPEAYTGSETPPPPPWPGTRERALWDARIGELRASGMSYEAIANELDTTFGTVANVCRRHGFTREVKRVVESTRRQDDERIG